MKGVVIIAAGHPYYTFMAYNLAVSIKYHCDIPICLFHEGAGLSFLFDDQKKVFDKLIPLPEYTFLINNKKEYIRSKLFIYDLTPFDETLYLDADMLFSPIKNPQHLFDELSNTSFQIACRGERVPGEKLRSEWIKVSDIKAIHGFDHWYELSSEVIYFKKSEEVKKIFDDAKRYYEHNGFFRIVHYQDPLVEYKFKNVENGDQYKEQPDGSIVQFAGGLPDEVCFGLAIEKNNIKIKSPFLPSYWQPLYFNKVIEDIEIYKNYYLISAGGAAVQANIKRIFDGTNNNNGLNAKYQAKQPSPRQPYLLVPKHDILEERKKI